MRKRKNLRKAYYWILIVVLPGQPDNESFLFLSFFLGFLHCSFFYSEYGGDQWWKHARNQVFHFRGRRRPYFQLGVINWTLPDRWKWRETIADKGLDQASKTEAQSVIGKKEQAWCEVVRVSGRIKDEGEELVEELGKRLKNLKFIL